MKRTIGGMVFTVKGKRFVCDICGQGMKEKAAEGHFEHCRMKDVVSGVEDKVPFSKKKVRKVRNEGLKYTKEDCAMEVWDGAGHNCARCKTWLEGIQRGNREAKAFWLTCPKCKKRYLTWVNP